MLFYQNNDGSRTQSRLEVNQDSWNFLALRQVSLTHPKISRDTWAKHVDASKLDQDSWIQNQIRSDWLAKQTKILAERLSPFVPEIFRPPEKWVSMVAADGTARVMDRSKYSNQNILPLVMQGNSRAMLRPLIRFASERPMSRMLVATAGPRVPIGLFKASLKAHNARVKDVLGPYLRSFKIEEYFRRTEYTIALEDGVHTYHIHTHILIDPPFIKDWPGFLSGLCKVFGSHIKDCGRIQNIVECCKYACKISKDMDEDSSSLGIMDLPQDELVQLHHSLKGAKLLRPVGPFSAFLKRLKDDKVVLRRLLVDRKTHTYKWVEVEKASGREVDAEHKGKCNRGNIVLGWTMGAFTSPEIRKHILVADYRGDFEALLSLRSLGKSTWAIGSPGSESVDPYKVHTATTTAYGDHSFSSRESIPPGGSGPPGSSFFDEKAVCLSGNGGVI